MRGHKGKKFKILWCKCLLEHQRSYRALQTFFLSAIKSFTFMTTSKDSLKIIVAVTGYLL
jgi:hypothetical protein